MSQNPMELILYSKPGCHLCEGLQEKLESVKALPLNLEVRNIMSCEEWLGAYEYEIPVLYQKLKSKNIRLPRLSPRASVQQIEQMLQNYYKNSEV